MASCKCIQRELHQPTSVDLDLLCEYKRMPFDKWGSSRHFHQVWIYLRGLGGVILTAVSMGGALIPRNARRLLTVIKGKGHTTEALLAENRRMKSQPY